MLSIPTTHAKSTPTYRRSKRGWRGSGLGGGCGCSCCNGCQGPTRGEKPQKIGLRRWRGGCRWCWCCRWCRGGCCSLPRVLGGLW
eukprot:1161875-Pelagomonas_calceolata.AAC.12